MDDDAFRQAFEAGRLEAFHHRDHVPEPLINEPPAARPAGK